MIIFSGTHIGASNYLKYEQGKTPLKSRSEYCEFVKKSVNDSGVELGLFETLPENETLLDDHQRSSFLKIWHLKKVLAPYRNRKIFFKTVPKSISKKIEEEKMFLKNKLLKLESKLEIIQSKSHESQYNSILDRSPSLYSKWQKGNDWPLQLKLIEDQKRNILSQIENLYLKKLGYNDLLRYLEESGRFIKEELLIEIKETPGLFFSKIGFYPVWKIDDAYVEASDSPWFYVNKSFMPRQAWSKLQSQKAPQALSQYLNITENSMGSEIQWNPSTLYFSEDNRILLKGNPQSGFIASHLTTTFTSPTDISVEGVLDSACLAKNSD